MQTVDHLGAETCVLDTDCAGTDFCKCGNGIPTAGFGRRLDNTGRRPLFGGLSYVSSIDESGIQTTNWGCYCQGVDEVVPKVAVSAF